jgi:hypothetical protein
MKAIVVVLSAGVLFACCYAKDANMPTQPTSLTSTPSTPVAPLGFTLSGVVTDSASQQPLADVTVEWQDAMADAPMWRGARTDSNGAYQIVGVRKIPAIQIRARKSGYADQSRMLKVAEDTTVNFALTPDTAQPIGR